MKILLINSPAKSQPVVRDMAGGLGFDGGNSVVLPPLELSYMTATLLNKGHEAKIIDSDVEDYKNDDIYRIIKEYKPEAIIATVSLPTIYNDCSFLQEICHYSSANVIAKTSISYPPILKEILKKSSADFCIYGECDLNIDKIIGGEERKGTAFLSNGKLEIVENSIVADLDKLPLPARNLIPNEKYHYILLGDKTTTMQTSRGCPYPCSYYCAYPLVQGKKWRSRSPEHVLREIEDIVNNYQIKKILFRDATFTLNKKRTHKICDLIIQKNLKIEWWCETRVDCLDSKLMQKMRQAGCQGMNIGVETGDPEILETQAKIGMTLEKLNVIRNIAQKLGLRLHFLLMVGLPKETKKTLYETYKLICALKPESIGITIVTPYPGTQLYTEAKEKGWIKTEDWSMFDGHSPIMRTDNLSFQDLVKAQRMIYRGFSLSCRGPISWIRLRLLDYCFKRWISQERNTS
ncbi:MAG: radical SAM protein [Proteobacteria bacterium]|nr:radical SAM protein [Pseudomonadota bacterium]MBU4127257.1 radical SAM protein [Pseudomonadota bacterium]